MDNWESRGDLFNKNSAILEFEDISTFARSLGVERQSLQSNTEDSLVHIVESSLLATQQTKYIDQG
jgi:3-dehydroquinate dehydratase